MIDDINKILDYYNFKLEDREEFLNIIKPIIFHEEFIKRYDTNNYPHHGNISLGYHIINVAVETFNLTKTEDKYKNVNYRLAIIIAMFHDLYEYPWQNSKIKKRKFTNRHGFVHPLEAVINAITWFPNYFKNLGDAQIIIDGMIHHMYPFPVIVIDKNIKNLELNNEKKYQNINKILKNYINNTCKRNKLFRISISKSKYLEGIIVSKADKKVALGKDLNTIECLKACLTGRNVGLLNRKNRI